MQMAARTCYLSFFPIDSISALNPSVTRALDISHAGADHNVLGKTFNGHQFLRRRTTGSWLDEISFSLSGDFSDRFMIDNKSKKTMLVYENSTTWEIGSFALMPRELEFPWPMFIPAITGAK